ncbi:DUF58 domain-containing protein [Planctomycetota bacterium]
MKDNGISKKLRKFLRNVPHLTFMGYNYILVALVAGLFAFHRRHSLVMLTFAIMLAALVVSFVFAFYSLRGLELKRFLQGSFTAGDLFVIQFEVENRKLFFPAFHILITEICANTVFTDTYYNFKAEIGLVPPRGKSFATYSGRIRERGILAFDLIRVSTRFPFGLFYCVKEFHQPETIRSLPRCRNIRGRGVFSGEVTGYSELEHSRWERGYDIFRGIREYRSGDNPKWIHWKSSAKLRNQLRVKEYNTSEERDIAIIFDPVSGWASRKNKNVKFEISLVYTVSLIKHYLDRGNVVTLHTLNGGFRSFERIRNYQDLRQVLSFMAGIRERQGFNFFEAVRERSRVLKRSGAGIVIIGAGIEQVYQELFLGYNIRVIDVAHENIRAMFPVRRIVV